MVAVAVEVISVVSSPDVLPIDSSCQKEFPVGEGIEYWTYPWQSESVNAPYEDKSVSILSKSSRSCWIVRSASGAVKVADAHSNSYSSCTVISLVA